MVINRAHIQTQSYNCFIERSIIMWLYM